MVDQLLHLVGFGDIGLNNGVARKGKLLGEALEPVQTPRAQDHLRPIFCKNTCGRFAQPAAGPGDDDDLAFYTPGHDAAFLV
jgi:hypothetical protein